MGCIADAIKKAEAERAASLRLGPVEPSTARLSATPMAGAPFAAEAMGTRPMPGVRLLTPRQILQSPATLSERPSWGVHSSLVTVLDKTSAITEQYRAVRTWLLSRMPLHGRGCMAITSSLPREGKSVTTANLAVTMSEVPHMQVLVVDCDLRQSALAKLFRVRNQPGLSDVLSGRADLNEAIVKTPFANLHVLPAGTCGASNPTELLNSRAASRVFDEIRERFHYVLVDTPSVQRSSDVGVIGALCGGVVMVVRMHRAASHVVKQSVRWLQSNNLNVMGCIAAACRPHDDRYADALDERDD